VCGSLFIVEQLLPQELKIMIRVALRVSVGYFPNIYGGASWLTGEIGLKSHLTEGALAINDILARYPSRQVDVFLE
jgi:hypothetical protein